MYKDQTHATAFRMRWRAHGRSLGMRFYFSRWVCSCGLIPCGRVPNTSGTDDIINPPESSLRPSRNFRLELEKITKCMLKRPALSEMKRFDGSTIILRPIGRRCLRCQRITKVWSAFYKGKRKMTVSSRRYEQTSRRYTPLMKRPSFKKGLISTGDSNISDTNKN